MDPHINPLYLRDRSFGQIDRFSYIEGAGIFSGFLNIAKKLGPYVLKLFSKAAPVVKSVAKNKIVRKTAKELGEHALQSGFKNIGKAISGENVSQSLKDDLAGASSIGLKGLHELVGSVTPQTARKKRKNTDPDQLKESTSNKKRKKKKKRNLRRDMFS